MKDKICLVTGANAGIGKATTTALSQTGTTVVMVCRNRERGQMALEEIRKKTGNHSLHLLVADLASQAGIRKLAEEFQNRFGALDVLINNASLLSRKPVFTSEGFEIQLAVNYLAYFLLTRLLLPLMQPGRIINVASDAHFGVELDLDYLQEKRAFSQPSIYSKTKLADILFTYELSRRLKDGKVTVNALHPGVVATNMLADYFHLPRSMKESLRLIGKSPGKGAETSVYLATSPEVEGVTGKYFSNKREKKSSSPFYNSSTAKKLWNISSDFTGLPADLS